MATKAGPWWPNSPLPIEFTISGVSVSDFPGKIRQYASTRCYAGGEPLILNPTGGDPYSVPSGSVDITLSFIDTSSTNTSPGRFEGRQITSEDERIALWSFLLNSIDSYVDKGGVYYQAISQYPSIVSSESILNQFEGINISLSSSRNVTGILYSYATLVQSGIVSFNNTEFSAQDIMDSYNLAWEEAMEYRSNSLLSLLSEEELSLVDTSGSTIASPIAPSFSPFQVIANVPRSSSNFWGRVENISDSSIGVGIYDMVHFRSGISVVNGIISYSGSLASSIEYSNYDDLWFQGDTDWVHVGLEYAYSPGSSSASIPDYWADGARKHAIQWSGGGTTSRGYALTAGRGISVNEIGSVENFAIVPSYMVYPELYQLLLCDGPIFDEVNQNIYGGQMPEEEKFKRRAVLFQPVASLTNNSLYLTTGSSSNKQALPGPPLPSEEMMYFYFASIDYNMLQTFEDDILFAGVVLFYAPANNPRSGGESFVRARLYNPIVQSEGFAHVLSGTGVWVALDLMQITRLTYFLTRGLVGLPVDPIWVVSFVQLGAGNLGFIENLYWNPVWNNIVGPEGTLLHHADQTIFRDNSSITTTKRSWRRSGDRAWNTSQGSDVDIDGDTVVDRSLYHVAHTRHMFGFADNYDASTGNNGLGLWNLGSVGFFASGSSHFLGRGQIRINFKARTLNPINRANLEFRFYLVPPSFFGNDNPAPERVSLRDKNFWDSQSVDSAFGDYEISSRLLRSDEDNIDGKPYAAGRKVYWNNGNGEGGSEVIDHGGDSRRQNAMMSPTLTSDATEYSMIFILDEFDEECSRLYHEESSWRGDQGFDLTNINGFQLYMHVRVWSENISRAPTQNELDAVLSAYAFEYEDINDASDYGFERSEIAKIEAIQNATGELNPGMVELYVGDGDFYISMPLTKRRSNSFGIIQPYSNSFRQTDNLDYDLLGNLISYVPLSVQENLFNQQVPYLYTGQINNASAFFNSVILLPSSLASSISDSDFDETLWPGYFMIPCERVGEGQISTSLNANQTPIEFAQGNSGSIVDFVTPPGLAQKMLLRGDSNQSYFVGLNLASSMAYSLLDQSQTVELDSGYLYVAIQYIDDSFNKRILHGPIAVPFSTSDGVMIVDIGPIRNDMTFLSSGRIVLSILPIIETDSIDESSLAIRISNVSLFSGPDEMLSFINVGPPVAPVGSSFNFTRGLPISGGGVTSAGFGLADEASMVIPEEVINDTVVLTSDGNVTIDIVLVSPIIRTDMTLDFGYVLDIDANYIGSGADDALFVLRSKEQLSGINTGIDSTIQDISRYVYTGFPTGDGDMKLFTSATTLSPTNLATVSMFNDLTRKITGDYVSIVGNTSIEDNPRDDTSSVSTMLFAVDRTTSTSPIVKGLMVNRDGTMYPPDYPRSVENINGFDEEHTYILRDIDYLAVQPDNALGGAVATGRHASGSLLFWRIDNKGVPRRPLQYVSGSMPNVNDQTNGYGELGDDIIIDTWPHNPLYPAYYNAQSSPDSASASPLVGSKVLPAFSTATLGAASYANVGDALASAVDGVPIAEGSPTLISNEDGHVYILFCYESSIGGNRVSPFLGRIYAIYSQDNGETWTPPYCVFSISPFYPSNSIINTSFSNIYSASTSGIVDFGFTSGNPYANQLGDILSSSPVSLKALDISNFSASLDNIYNMTVLTFWMGGFICYTDISRSLSYGNIMWRQMDRTVPASVGRVEYPWNHGRYSPIYNETFQDGRNYYTYRFWYPDTFQPLYIAAGPVEELGSVSPASNPGDSIGIATLKAYSILETSGKDIDPFYYDDEWELYFPTNVDVAMSQYNKEGIRDSERIEIFGTSQNRQRPGVAFLSESNTPVIQFASLGEKMAYAPMIIHSGTRSNSYPLEVDANLVDYQTGISENV